MGCSTATFIGDAKSRKILASVGTQSEIGDESQELKKRDGSKSESSRIIPNFGRGNMSERAYSVFDYRHENEEKNSEIMSCYSAPT